MKWRYPVEIYQMCDNKLPTSRLSKLIIWQTYIHAYIQTWLKLYATTLRGWSNIHYSITDAIKLTGHCMDSQRLLLGSLFLNLSKTSISTYLLQDSHYISMSLIVLSMQFFVWHKLRSHRSRMIISYWDKTIHCCAGQWHYYMTTSFQPSLWGPIFETL